jgi:hypothetical protein
MKRKHEDEDQQVNENKVIFNEKCFNFTQMGGEWCKNIPDSDERKNFISKITKNEFWYQTTAAKQIESLITEDSLFAFVVGNLIFIPVNPLERGGYKYGGLTEGICVDDLKARYIYLECELKKPEVLAQSAEMQEEHIGHLFELEKLRITFIQQGQSFNQALKKVQEKHVKLFDSPLEGWNTIPYLRFFPDLTETKQEKGETEEEENETKQEKEDEEEEENPFDSVIAEGCSDYAVLMELAFDIVRLGSLQEVNQQMGFYYRVLLIQ